MQHTIVGVRRKTQRCKLYTFKYVCNSTSCIIYSKKSYSTRAVLVLSLVSQCCLTLCCPMDCSSPGSLCLWGFSTQEYWSGLPCPPLWDLPNPGIKTRFPTLQADSLPSEPQEKLKNTGVGSYPFSRGTSWPRNLTGISYIAGIFFTSWATQEAHITSFVSNSILSTLLLYPHLFCIYWNYSHLVDKETE